MPKYVACLLAAAASVFAQIPAFPGAEGAGAFTPGGRGGDVYHVTNLEDSGPGSLRAGISTATGPRTIVFDVSGTIQLKSKLPINKPFLTLAGQTAPGDGITVAGWTTSVTDTHDVIVRYLRFRAGDINCPAYQDDAFDVDKSTNVIVDHVSSSWSVDETLSVTESDKVTVQWSFITESMKSSCHEKGEHGYGTLMRYGNGSYTFHHNLYAHHQSRNPRIGDDLSVDFVNNIIYDAGSEVGYSGPADEGTTKINYVGNYIVAGPSTAASRRTRAFLGGSDNTQIYQTGNLIDSNVNGRRDGIDTGWAMFTNPLTRRDARFDVVPTKLDDAATAYARVLASAGASLVRDAVDLRIVDEVQNDKGKLINSQKDVGGWPVLNSRKAPLDTDQDGIPDVWEVTHGLNPADPRDGAAAWKGCVYTNLEMYLADLVSPASETGAALLDTSFEDASSKFLFNGRSTSARADKPGTVTFDMTATAANSEAFWAYFTDSGKPVTLGVGDKLTVSLDFSVQGFAKNGSDVRFGVLDSMGTRNTANLTGGMNDSSFVGDTGYALDYFASGTGSPFVLARRSVLSTANVFNSFGDFTPIPGTGASARQSLADDTRYTLTYTVQRQSATSTALSVSVSGGDLADLNYASVENNPTPNTTFDYFAFRIGGTNFARTITFHRMNVSYLPAPPVITSQPQPTALTVQVGSSVTLTVGASGSALAYQWQRNGQNLDGQTGATLALKNMQISDAGSYTAVVSNAGGSTTSNAVTLRVSVDPVPPPPAISQQPRSITATVNTAAIVDVTATGDNLIYQWFKAGSAIPGATARQLPFTSARVADAGQYYVVVSNGSGSITSNVATVQVVSALRLTRTAPASLAQSVCADTPLTMQFDAPVRVGRTGRIRVYRGNGTLADTIDMAASPQTKLVGGTVYNYLPVMVSGDTATVYLHGPLPASESYSITVEPGVLTDTDGAPFAGITDPNAWTLSVREPAGSNLSNITVAADGSGDFCTLQSAIDAVPAGNTKPVTITVKPGTYTEINYIPSNKPFLTIRGADRATTVIQYPNNANLNSGNQRVMFGVDAADFTLEDITLRNTTPKGGSQAEALRTNNARTTINRVSFYSYQDTLFLNGQAFITDSYIEGDVDFMWGNGTVFFRNSEIRAVSSGGYYTQIRNTQNQKGNVYVNCRLTAPDGVTGVYLGRIDPGVFPYSQVVWIDSVMGPHIHPAGWLLNNATTAPNVQFWEYNSRQPDGSPVNTSQRLTASRQLTAAEAARWNDPAFVLDGWVPYTVNATVDGPVAAVNWTAPPGHSDKDWIGLYEVGAPDTGYISWQYTGASHQGRLPFAVPSSGNYELRMYLADEFKVRVATVNISR